MLRRTRGDTRWRRSDDGADRLRIERDDPAPRGSPASTFPTRQRKRGTNCGQLRAAAILPPPERAPPVKRQQVRPLHHHPGDPPASEWARSDGLGVNPLCRHRSPLQTSPGDGHRQEQGLPSRTGSGWFSRRTFQGSGSRLVRWASFGGAGQGARESPGSSAKGLAVAPARGRRPPVAASSGVRRKHATTSADPR